MNLTKQQTYFFDFDQTFITQHSKGHPSGMKLDINTRRDYQALLNKIKGKIDKKIYIVSRGIKAEIEQFLINNEIYHFINGVYGAEDNHELLKGTPYWANKKVDMMEKILKKDNANKELAKFYDDTFLNVKTALEADIPSFIITDRHNTRNSIYYNGKNLLQYVAYNHL